VLIEPMLRPSNTAGGSCRFLPGMVSSVEILTGHKTVLQYLLEPINKTRTRRSMSADVVCRSPREDGAAGLVAWSEPQFRVVTTGTRRRGSASEGVFWKLAGRDCQAARQKRAHLITEVLDSARRHRKRGELLRCYVASASISTGPPC